MYAKYEASIPCSYLETELSPKAEHFDHMQANMHRGYHISTPLLREGALKTRKFVCKTHCAPNHMPDPDKQWSELKVIDQHYLKVNQ